VHEEIAEVQMCEGIAIGKELKSNSDVLVAHIWLCEATDRLVYTPIPPILQQVLSQFPKVFDNCTIVPPARDIDHKIPLKPNS
jgi:Reverse transcriptase (RNA-dependent DNA polymerase)